MDAHVQDRLTSLLDHLESDLEPREETAIETRYRRALAWETVDRLPVIVSCPQPPSGDLEPYPHSEAVRDPQKMLFNELVSAWGTSVVRRVTTGDDLPVTIRANMGTVLVASCFGATVEQPGDDPPWARPLASREAFVKAIDADESPDSDHVRRAGEFMAFYRERLSAYDKLSRLVKITVPDLQGPLDNAAMLRGSDLFMDAALDPPLFAAALERMTRAQLDLVQRFRPLTLNEPDGFVHQHGVLVRGNLLIRNDSAVMVSPQMYAEQIGPCDERVMHAVGGGGGLHSCGSIDHVFEHYLEHPSVRSIDYGQSTMNDVDAHYRLASERRVALLRVEAMREELVSGSILTRFPTGVALLYNAASNEDAAEVMRAYGRWGDG